MDFVVLFVGAKCISNLWASLYYDNPTYYDSTDINRSIGIASIVLILSYAFFGQYDKRHNVKHLIYGFVFGALGVLSIYGLLPLEMRFSRFVLLTIVLLSPVVLYLTRLVYNKVSDGSFSFDTLSSKRIAIVGERSSCIQVEGVIKTHLEDNSIIGHINSEDSALGGLDDLQHVVQSRGINELVFCSKDFDSSYMLDAMATLGNKISYKIASDDNRSFLGSDSKNEVGEWYTMDIGFKIDQVFHKRSKRSLDILFGVTFIIFSPIVLMVSKQRSAIFKNLFPVLLGKKSWIGYKNEDSSLPLIKKGVFSPLSSDAYYARSYSVWMEIENILKNVFK